MRRSHANAISDYNRYRAILESCHGRNVSRCPEAQIQSWVSQSSNGADTSSANLTLQPPLVAITRYLDQGNQPSHWNCNGRIFSSSSFLPYDPDIPQSGQNGVCRSGSRFAWGFSFLLLFVTACLNLVFALVMYLIWLSTREKTTTMSDGSVPIKREHNIVLDAIALSTQAQEHYGQDVAKWNARSVKHRILKGRKGMTRAE